MLSECFKRNVCLNQRQKNQLCQNMLNLRTLMAKENFVEIEKTDSTGNGFIGLLLKPVLSALKGLLNFLNGQENDFNGFSLIGIITAETLYTTRIKKRQHA